MLKHGQNETSQLLYRRIYADLKAIILSGKILPSERLPSEKEISERYCVCRMTARQAYGLLENEGLISRQRGVGTFSKPLSTEGDTEQVHLRMGVIHDPASSISQNQPWKRSAAENRIC